METQRRRLDTARAHQAALARPVAPGTGGGQRGRNRNRVRAPRHPRGRRTPARLRPRGARPRARAPDSARGRREAPPVEVDPAPLAAERPRNGSKGRHERTGQSTARSDRQGHGGVPAGARDSHTRDRVHRKLRLHAEPVLRLHVRLHVLLRGGIHAQRRRARQLGPMGAGEGGSRRGAARHGPANRRHAHLRQLGHRPVPAAGAAAAAVAGALRTAGHCRGNQAGRTDQKPGRRTRRRHLPADRGQGRPRPGKHDRNHRRRAAAPRVRAVVPDEPGCASQAWPRCARQESGPR